MWKIFNLELEEGQKLQTYLEPYEAGYKMPATLINGKYPGKTLFITAGIHSCEWVGTPTTIKLAQEIDPEKLHGRIIMLHMVNVTGFWLRRIRFMPEDGRNLNDLYPVKEKPETVTDNIALWLHEEVMPNIDFYLDLHTGAPGQELRPILFYPLEPCTKDLSLAAAKCVNIPYLIESRNHAGPMHHAAWHHHVPGMLLERGCGGFCFPEWVQEDMADCKRIMNHLDMYDFAVEPAKTKQQLVSPMVDIYADAEGIWYPAVRVDQTVHNGDLLGRLEDVWGNLVKEYYADEDFIVFYYTTALPIKPGYMLVSGGAFQHMTEV